MSDYGKDIFGRPLGVLGRPLMEPSIQQSMTNLQSTLDPRDQMAHELRSGTVTSEMLDKRWSQIDPRDQEATDILRYRRKYGL